MKKMLWVMVCSSFVLLTQAQVFQKPGSLQSIGHGGFVKSVDIFSMLSNPSSAASLERNALGAAIEKPFLLKDLHSYVLSGAISTTWGNVGLHFDRFTYGQYSESNSNFIIARSLGSGIAIGSVLSYARLKIGAGYGSAGSVGYGLSLRLRLSERVTGGFLVSNPGNRKLPRSPLDKHGALLSFGIGFQGTSFFSCSMEMRKRQGSPAGIYARCRYNIRRNTAISAAVNTGTSVLSLSFSCLVQKINVVVGGSYQQLAGYTPVLAIEIGGEEKNR